MMYKVKPGKLGTLNIHYCSINTSRFINLYQQLVLTMHILQVQFVQDHCLISVLNALTLLADFIC